MAKTVKIDDMGKEIAKTFQEFAKATRETCEKAIDETCKETVQELKQNSPKNHGNYAKSWKYGPSPFKKDKLAKIIYNKEHYRLTHLLENGHKKRNGGAVEGQPHIAPAERHAGDLAVQKIKEGIRNQ